MTHDEFLETLHGLESSPDGEPEFPRALPSEALAHARACPPCRRVAEALASLAVDDAALFEEPGPDYWRDFDQRLARRLAVERREGRRPAWGAGLRVAALVALALGLGWFGLRGVQGLSQPGPSLQAEVEPELGAQGSVEPFAWEALGGDLLEGGAVLSVGGGPRPGLLDDWERLPGFAHSPIEELHEELSLELDEEQAAALARALRAEMSS